MSNLPKKTDLPDFLDVDFANSLDLHIACSDMINHLDKYANQQALVYIWNKAKHAADPIQAQAQFFTDLNNASLNLKDNAVSKNTDVDYFAKLNTFLEPNEVWIYDEEGNIDKNEAGEYHVYNLETRREDYIAYPEKTDEVVQDKINLLDEIYGAADLDENFLLFWIDKFRKCHHEVKEQFRSLISADELNHFTEVSDSIGLVTRPQEAFDDRLIPYFEANFRLFQVNLGPDVLIDATPSVTNAVIDDKLDNGTKELHQDIAIRTNHIFRRNLLALKEGTNYKGNGKIAFANMAHGEDLVTDFNYLNQMSNTLITDLNGSIANKYAQGITKALTFIKLQNSNNEQTVSNNIFNLVVENNIQKVDVLKNKLNAVTKFITNDDVLKSTGVDLSDVS
jgi:hypothetical protein